MGRVLHDDHHGDDGRATAKCIRCRASAKRGHRWCCSPASRRSSTPRRSSWRWWSRAACRRNSAGAGSIACCTRSRTTSSSAATAASAAIIAEEFRKQGVPYVVIDRDGRARAGSARVRRPRGRSGREPRRRADARRHPPRARADRGRRHGRRKRLHRAERARAAARSVHHRARGVGGRRAEAAARGRGSRDLAVSARRQSRWPRRRCGRRSSISCGWRPRPSGSICRRNRSRSARTRRLSARTLREANFRQAFGVIVVAIKRADGHMQFNPEPDDMLRAGDQLVVLGNPDQLRALEETAGPALAVDGVRPSGRGGRTMARRLDGAALAASDSRGARSAGGGASPRARPPPGLERGAGRATSRVRDLRAQQAEGGRRSRLPRRAGSPRCERDASTRRWPRSRGSMRTTRCDAILVQSPLPEGMGARRRAAGLRRARSGEGRRRISSGQRRPARAETADAGRVHAARLHRAARARADRRSRGRARRRHRPQRHRRQADGAAAAASRRDGDRLPLADASICRGSPRRRTCSSPPWAARDS